MSPFKLFNRVDIEEDLLRFPSPISLWNDALYAIMQVVRLTCCIACIPNLANDGFLSDNSTNMRVNLT